MDVGLYDNSVVLFDYHLLCFHHLHHFVSQLLSAYHANSDQRHPIPVVFDKGKPYHSTFQTYFAAHTLSASYKVHLLHPPSKTLPSWLYSSAPATQLAVYQVSLPSQLSLLSCYH